MSNHDGSYMLNEVLHLLDRAKVFEKLGKKDSQRLLLDLIKISDQHDCNPGEILEGIGEKLGICYCCRRTAEDLEGGICGKCRKSD